MYSTTRSSAQRIFVSCLVVVIFICIADTSAREFATSRIAGGYQTTVADAPYLIQLRRSNNDSFVCGASLVTPVYVITAGHCMLDEDYDNLLAVGGASALFEKGVVRKVIKVELHPEYSFRSAHSDIAILKLSQPMQGPKISTVPLCGRALKVGDKVKVSGWGPTVKGGPLSPYLRSVSIPVRSMEDCRDEYRSFVEKNMFCASGYESKGVCRGDSGGPAIFNGQLCGVNAMSWHCGKADSSGSFTDVYALRSYIQSVIRK